METGGKEPLLSARTYNNFQFKGNLNPTHSGRGRERAGEQPTPHVDIACTVAGQRTRPEEQQPGSSGEQERAAF